MALVQLRDNEMQQERWPQGKAVAGGGNGKSKDKYSVVNSSHFYGEKKFDFCFNCVF